MNKKCKHIEKIKEKLNLALLSNEDSINQLVSKLYELGYSFSYNTIYDTISMSTKTLNTMVIVALCKYWNLDLNYVFCDPDEDEITDKLYNFQKNNDGFIPFLDEKYAGVFNFYFIRFCQDNCSTLENLVKAKLEIQINEHTSNAVLSLFTEDGITIGKIFQGTPYLSTISNNVIIFFHNDLGEFYFLSILYKNYITKNMSFKIGNLESFSYQNDKMPLMRKVVILRNDIKPENEKFILGLLDSDSTRIAIRKKDFDVLKKNEPIVETFAREFEKFLDYHEYPIYMFTEQQILHEFDINMEYDDIFKALMLIKNVSISPKLVLSKESHEIYTFTQKL